MEIMERRVTHPAADDKGEAALWVLGELITVRARGEAYTLLESTAPPGGGGMPPHLHRDQDEAIYVIEGEYILLVSGDEEMRLGPGSFASVGRAKIHALKVTGDGPGRSLAILAPPGPLEGFFDEVGVPVADRSTSSLAGPDDPPDMEEVVASARRHGTFLLTRPV